MNSSFNSMSVRVRRISILKPVVNFLKPSFGPILCQLLKCKHVFCGEVEYASDAVKLPGLRIPFLPVVKCGSQVLHGYRCSPLEVDRVVTDEDGASA